MRELASGVASNDLSGLQSLSERQGTLITFDYRRLNGKRIRVHMAMIMRDYDESDSSFLVITRKSGPRRYAFSRLLSDVRIIGAPEE